MATAILFCADFATSASCWLAAGAALVFAHALGALAVPAALLPDEPLAAEALKLTAPDLLDTLAPQKLAPSPDTVPERFELGTLPYELLAGTTAAVDFLAGLDPDATGSRRDRLTASMATVERHEDGLRRRIEAAPHAW